MGSGPEFALHKLKPILTPEQFAVNHIAGRAEHARLNRLLGVGFVTFVNRLAVGLPQPASSSGSTFSSAMWRSCVHTVVELGRGEDPLI